MKYRWCLPTHYFGVMYFPYNLFLLAVLAPSSTRATCFVYTFQFLLDYHIAGTVRYFWKVRQKIWQADQHTFNCLRTNLNLP